MVQRLAVRKHRLQLRRQARLAGALPAVRPAAITRVPCPPENNQHNVASSWVSADSL